MKIDALINSQMLGNTANVSDILKKLNIGDVLRAQIIEIASSDLILKLFDGTTLKAETESPIDAKKGDFVNFSVKDNSNGKLFLEPVKNNAIKPINIENELKKSLSSMDIKPDAKNIEIAKELSTSKLPFTRENLEKIIDLVTKFKDIDPKKAIFLTTNNLQAEDRNIESLNNLLSGKLKLGDNLKNLTTMLSKIEDNQVIDNIENSLKQYISETDTDTQIKKTDNNTNPIIKEQIGKNLESLLKSLNSNSENIKSNINNLKNVLNTISENNEINIDNNLKKELTALIASNVNDFENMTKDDNTILTRKINELISKLNVDTNEPNSILDKNTKGDNKVIKDVFEKLFIDLSNGKLDKDTNIKDLYKDIYNKLHIIKENIENSNIPFRNDILSKIDDMHSSISFLNDVNNNNNVYIQLPIKTLDNKTTGELYIIKKESKRKRINPEDATMFISLNTQNIGQVDSLVSVNKKNVSINFRVENNEVINFIKNNYKEMYNTLLEKGYKLVDFKCRLIREGTNILNIDEVVNKEFEEDRMSIDLKI